MFFFQQTILELSPFHLDTLIIMAEQLAQHDAHESRNLTGMLIYFSIHINTQMRAQLKFFVSFFLKFLK